MFLSAGVGDNAPIHVDSVWLIVPGHYLSLSDLAIYSNPFVYFWAWRHSRMRTQREQMRHYIPRLIILSEWRNRCACTSRPRQSDPSMDQWKYASFSSLTSNRVTFWHFSCCSSQPLVSFHCHKIWKSIRSLLKLA